jgi:hypothetical protein
MHVRWSNCCDAATAEALIVTVLEWWKRPLFTAEEQQVLDDIRRNRRCATSPSLPQVDEDAHKIVVVTDALEQGELHDGNSTETVDFVVFADI